MRVLVRSAVLALAPVAVMMGTAAPSSAIIDPVGAVTCLSETPAAITNLADPAAVLDPAGLHLPAEVPGVSCLAP
ncbi:hypothetical protein ACGFNU_47705 [Spirillospora sp. NPDC048911]|uniref:hypothetical protein n=1 Tax=Spirillospora sp. NPDC048911 TaxID=3364527 RepID=UPI003711ED58